MAPTYKLTYFNGKGAAESIRYLFKYGNIEFEDNRIEQADWPKLKNSTPYGQLPILEHNGQVVNQTVAINRYVGKLVKLAGNDDWENLEIDAIVDTIGDLRQKIYGLNSDDEAKKKALTETFVNETVPYYFSRLDAIVAKKGYLALGRLTWADTYLAAAKDGLDRMFPGALDNFKNIKALADKVHEIPAIKKWVAERPDTPF